MLIWGSFRQDCSSHWYFIPEEYIEGFDADAEKLDEDDADACDRFDRRYGHYRIDGGPGSELVALETP